MAESSLGQGLGPLFLPFPHPSGAFLSNPAPCLQSPLLAGLLFQGQDVGGQRSADSRLQGIEPVDVRTAPTQHR